MGPEDLTLMRKHAGLFQMGANALRAGASRLAPMAGKAMGAIGGAFRAAPGVAQAAGAAAPALRNSIWNTGASMARGAMGFGAREGATGLMHGAHTMGALGAVGVPMAAAAISRPTPQPGMNVMAALGAREAARKYAGLDDLDPKLELSGLATLGLHPLYSIIKHRGLDLVSALEIAGLGQLAVPPIRALMHKNPNPSPQTVA